MQETLRRMREKRVGGDRGFTLIELLVVVVIIGVLVAIAIPVYLNYRKGAENRATQSDVRTAITAIEQCYADNGNQYPATQAQVTGPAAVVLPCSAGAININVTTGNKATYTKTANGYTYQVVGPNKTYTYDNTTG